MLLHGRFDVFHRGAAPGSSTTRRTGSRVRSRGRRRGGVPPAAARLRDRRAPVGRRGGRASRTSSSNAPTTIVEDRLRVRGRSRRSKPSSSRRSRPSARERFRPRPSEFACSGCPALDRVCAGPRLGRGGSEGDLDWVAVERPPAHDRSMATSYRARGAPACRPEARADRPIVERLRAEHPDAGIALSFRSDLELLVATILSAQTTDVTVNRVTASLFEKYRRPEDYLAVPLAELEADIRPTGTFRQKARNLRGSDADPDRGLRRRGAAQRSHELVRLPGVGRKVANVVAAERGAVQGIVVDTHVRRLSQRLGLTRHDDPREDRARPAAARPARRLGHLPASPDLARTACLRRAIAHAATSARSPTSARPAGPDVARRPASFVTVSAQTACDPCASSAYLRGHAHRRPGHLRRFPRGRGRRALGAARARPGPAQTGGDRARGSTRATGETVVLLERRGLLGPTARRPHAFGAPPSCTALGGRARGESSCAQARERRGASSRRARWSHRRAECERG